MRVRLAILLTMLGALALVYAHLLSQHATIGDAGLNYGMCEVYRDTDYFRETCANWRMEARIEALAIVLFTGAVLVYVGRRPEGGK